MIETSIPQEGQEGQGASFLPQPVDDIEMAFGGEVNKLLPPYEAIPEQFKRFQGTKWNRLFSAWFFRGLESYCLLPKEGIDESAALRHIRAVMASWEPKHEHKEAGVAYLFSLWFEDAEWVAKEGDR